MSHTEPSERVCGSMRYSGNELALAREHLDAIVRAVTGVDHAVVRHLGAVHRVAELSWQRRGRIVRAEVVVRRRLAVGAPHPLDLAAVEVDNGDALVQVTVGDVAFVGLRIDEDLRDAAEVVHVEAVRAVDRLVGGRRRVLARAGLAVLRHELAVARELQDVRVGLAVAADPHEALVIDDDAVVALGPRIRRAGDRAAPSADVVAGRVELHDRRRRHAALADARAVRCRHRELGAIEVRRIVATMDDPDMVVGRNTQANRLPEHVVVGHRLRPERIHFEARNLFGLRRNLVEIPLDDAQRRQNPDKSRARK